MVTRVVAAGAVVLAFVTGLAFAQQATSDTGSTSSSGEETNDPGAVSGPDDDGSVPGVPPVNVPNGSQGHSSTGGS